MKKIFLETSETKLDLPSIYETKINLPFGQSDCWPSVFRHESYCVIKPHAKGIMFEITTNCYTDQNKWHKPNVLWGKYTERVYLTYEKLAELKIDSRTLGMFLSGIYQSSKYGRNHGIGYNSFYEFMNENQILYDTFTVNFIHPKAKFKDGRIFAGGETYRAPIIMQQNGKYFADGHLNSYRDRGVEMAYYLITNEFDKIPMESYESELALKYFNDHFLNIQTRYGSYKNKVEYILGEPTAECKLDIKIRTQDPFSYLVDEEDEFY